MSANANYASVMGSGQRGVLSAANANRDGTGTIVTIATGPASGMRIDDITIQATGTTTAGMIRLYLSFDSGTTNDCVLEIPVQPITPSATAAAWQARLTNLAYILPNATAMLRASTHNAENFRVVVTRKGDF
jgi:hypothetical protein